MITTQDLDRHSKLMDVASAVLDRIGADDSERPRPRRMTWDEFGVLRDARLGYNTLIRAARSGGMATEDAMRAQAAEMLKLRARLRDVEPALQPASGDWPDKANTPHATIIAPDGFKPRNIRVFVPIDGGGGRYYRLISESGLADMESKIQQGQTETNAGKEAVAQRDREIAGLRERLRIHTPATTIIRHTHEACERCAGMWYGRMGPQTPGFDPAVRSGIISPDARPRAAAGPDKPLSIWHMPGEAQLEFTLRPTPQPTHLSQAGMAQRLEQADRRVAQLEAENKHFRERLAESRGETLKYQDERDATRERLEQSEARNKDLHADLQRVLAEYQRVTEQLKVMHAAEGLAAFVGVLKALDPATRKALVYGNWQTD